MGFIYIKKIKNGVYILGTIEKRKEDSHYQVVNTSLVRGKTQTNVHIFMTWFGLFSSPSLI